MPKRLLASLMRALLPHKLQRHAGQCSDPGVAPRGDLCLRTCVSVRGGSLRHCLLRLLECSGPVLQLRRDHGSHWAAPALPAWQWRPRLLGPPRRGLLMSGGMGPRAGCREGGRAGRQAAWEGVERLRGRDVPRACGSASQVTDCRVCGSSSCRGLGPHLFASVSESTP